MQIGDSTAPQGTHYFIMVLEAINGSTHRKWASSGHITPAPGATRYDMERSIRAELVQSYGPDAYGAVATYFDIQPNAL